MFEYQKGNVPIKVWLNQQDYYADASLSQQAEALARHPHVFHHVALMPDCHGGYGMPIGGVAAFKDFICPYGVGMDIGCGMISVETNLKASDIDRSSLEQLKERIKKVIPMGFSHQTDPDHVKGVAVDLMTVGRPIPSGLHDVATYNQILCQLGTLGGGNHFIEVQEDERGVVWLMLHSGSRNLGATTCKKFHRIASEFCQNNRVPIPHKELAVLPVTATEGIEYIDAMNYCLDFAFDNRCLMMYRLLKAMGKIFSHVGEVSRVHVHHNYAAPEEHFGERVWVHRKGATGAALASLGVIPGSMGTASHIVEGKGVADSYNSCSHGGGRRMSRGQAKQRISMTDFKNAMGDVVYDHDKSLLDESPGAYKDISVVMANQADLVAIRRTLKPLLAVKATSCKEE